MTKTLLMTVAALAIALPATSFAAQTDANVKTEGTLIDRIVTGSIGDASTCGTVLGASPDCSGERDQTIKFPAAPADMRYGF